MSLDQNYQALAAEMGDDVAALRQEAIAASTADRVRSNHTGSQASTTISDFAEAVQDAVAAMLTSGTNITLSYDDTAGTLSVTAAGDDAEFMRDTIGVALTGIGNISVAVNDGADTITISTTATVNSTDASLRDRSTHTGSQLAATISDFSAAVAALLTNKIDYRTTYTTDPVTGGRTEGYHFGLDLDYDTNDPSQPESFMVKVRDSSAVLKKAFWLNESGLPRSWSIRKEEPSAKFHAFDNASTGPVIEVRSKWDGGAIRRWGISGQGYPLLGVDQIVGAHTIVLSAAAAVPANLPAGTVIVRTA